METIYNKEYFIAKFEAIPAHEIGQNGLMQHCALHHVGVGIVDGVQTGRYYHTHNIEDDLISVPITTPESDALVRLFGGKRDTDFDRVYAINDGNNGYNFLGKTPKERILNKLRSLS